MFVTELVFRFAVHSMRFVDFNTKARCSPYMRTRLRFLRNVFWVVFRMENSSENHELMTTFDRNTASVDPQRGREVDFACDLWVVRHW